MAIARPTMPIYTTSSWCNLTIYISLDYYATNIIAPSLITGMIPIAFFFKKILVGKLMRNPFCRTLLWYSGPNMQL
eukprot:jgi/Bigna1/61756/fgenesh1_kg.26_\